MIYRLTIKEKKKINLSEILHGFVKACLQLEQSFFLINWISLLRYPLTAQIIF